MIQMIHAGNRQQRMEHARGRSNIYTQLMENLSTQLFHRLIKRNRNNVHNFTNCIYKNFSYLFLPKDQRHVFAEYYEDLSKPSNDDLALYNIRQQFLDDEMKAAQPFELFQEHEIKSVIEIIILTRLVKNMGYMQNT